MVQFPDSPATDQTMRRCVVLWILLENKSRVLSYKEILDQAHGMIDRKLGRNKRFVWPGVHGTDEIFKDLRAYSNISGSQFIGWLITSKGEEFLRNTEIRFLPSETLA